MPGHGWAGRVFRANRRYELVVADRLSAPERAELAGQGDGVYGVLRPRRGAPLDVLAVSPDTALLFLTLREPGPLPRYVGQGAGASDAVRRLVLDGVLEVREPAGEFLSGVGAAGLLALRTPRGGSGRIAELSLAAVQYGQQLRALPEAALAQRLYAYGRRPLSPELAAGFPDAAAVSAKLGADRIDPRWAALPGDGVPWLRWRIRIVGGGVEGALAPYKLYVSPAVEAVGEVFRTVAGVLATARGVTALKVGRDLAGLCRPDKLLAYFARLGDLQEAAARLVPELAGCPAHGVPFTAAATADGLLSWGQDPPSDRVPTSWRMWVSEQLAGCLARPAGPEGGGVEPWQAALERLRLSGIDPDSWIPAQSMWDRATADGQAVGDGHRR